MKLKRTILISMVTLFVFVGCGKDEDIEEFNKPALYWYQKIAKNIIKDNLDKADAYYISLKSEHISSILMPNALMILANAHIHNEEYILANYYLNEYNKRYGTVKEESYIKFMKLKASFLGLKDVFKDQKLIMDTIEKSQNYLNNYPNSTYIPLVNTMLIRLNMSQYLLNENIASLYDRTGKKEASKIYRAKNKNSSLNLSDIEAPKQTLIGKIFD